MKFVGDWGAWVGIPQPHAESAMGIGKSHWPAEGVSWAFIVEMPGGRSVEIRS